LESLAFFADRQERAERRAGWSGRQVTGRLAGTAEQAERAEQRASWSSGSGRLAGAGRAGGGQAGAAGRAAGAAGRQAGWSGGQVAGRWRAGGGQVAGRWQAGWLERAERAERQSGRAAGRSIQAVAKTGRGRPIMTEIIGAGKFRAS